MDWDFLIETFFLRSTTAERIMNILENNRLSQQSPLLWQVKCPGRNTWFTGPAIAVTRWYVVHLMIPGTWSTVVNLIDVFCRALILADGKLSSQHSPWRQVPHFFSSFYGFLCALLTHTHVHLTLQSLPGITDYYRKKKRKWATQLLLVKQRPRHEEIFPVKSPQPSTFGSDDTTTAVV
jgi:hypothetical protein